MWVPVWKHLAKVFPTPQELVRKIRRRPAEPGEEAGAVSQETTEKPKHSSTWVSALLLGSAMVARGEIGLLIIEIGYNETHYVSQEGFITGIWAILLNTIIGPMTVGILVKFYGKRIGEGEWGLQKQIFPGREENEEHVAV